jgi:hypothetical protein
MALMMVASFLPQNVTELGIDSKGGRLSDLSILTPIQSLHCIKMAVFKNNSIASWIEYVVYQAIVWLDCFKWQILMR